MAEGPVKKQRRLWVHEITKAKPFGLDSMCSLCDRKLARVCKRRCGDWHFDFEEWIRTVQLLWTTMQLLSRRPPFQTLSMDIVQLIYSLSIPEGPHPATQCPVVSLPCGHTYHEHCVRQWVANEAIYGEECQCPEEGCQTYRQEELKFSTVDFCACPRMQLIQTYRSNKSFVSKSEIRFCEERAYEIIRSVMRNQKFIVWPQSALMSICNANSHIALQSFDRVFKRLEDCHDIRRIVSNPSETCYEYSPVLLL